MGFSRLGPAGFGVQREGSFAGRGISQPVARPAGPFTRFGLAGYGTARAGLFARIPAIIAPSMRLLDVHGAMPPAEFGGLLAKRPAAESIDGIEDIEVTPEFAFDLDVNGARTKMDDIAAGEKPTIHVSIDPDFSVEAPAVIRRTINGNLVN